MCPRLYLYLLRQRRQNTKSVSNERLPRCFFGIFLWNEDGTSLLLRGGETKMPGNYPAATTIFACTTAATPTPRLGSREPTFFSLLVLCCEVCFFGLGSPRRNVFCRTVQVTKTKAPTRVSRVSFRKGAACSVYWYRVPALIQPLYAGAWSGAVRFYTRPETQAGKSEVCRFSVARGCEYLQRQFGLKHLGGTYDGFHEGLAETCRRNDKNKKHRVRHPRVQDGIPFAPPVRSTEPPSAVEILLAAHLFFLIKTGGAIRPIDVGGTPRSPACCALLII